MDKQELSRVAREMALWNYIKNAYWSGRSDAMYTCTSIMKGENADVAAELNALLSEQEKEFDARVHVDAMLRALQDEKVIS